MKLPVNIITRFLLNRIVVPALATAVVKGTIDKADVKATVTDAIEAAALKKLTKLG